VGAEAGFAMAGGARGIAIKNYSAENHYSVPRRQCRSPVADRILHTKGDMAIVRL